MDLSPAPEEYRISWLRRLLGRTRVRTVALGREAISCHASDGRPLCAPFPWDDVALPEVSTSRMRGAVTLIDASGRRFPITGLSAEDAFRLGGAIRARRSLAGAESDLASLVAWAESHDALFSGRSFVTRSELEAWHAAWAGPAAWERAHREPIAIALPRLSQRVAAGRRAWDDPLPALAEANDRFVQAETARHAPLFDDIQGRSLTAQQREVAVRHDTDLLVIAGAGTGKTQAIAGKVAYLVRAGLARPEEILIVAFNTKAAEELRERAGRAGGEGVEARTFHSLGHAILGSPALLEEATDEAAMQALLEHLSEDLRREPGYEAALAELILLHREPLIPTVCSADFDAYIRSVKSASLRPLSGRHRVRNVEELRIADWLWLHGIEYEYEKVYPTLAPVDGSGRTGARTGPLRLYRPTFYLPRYEIWLAHLPVDREGQPPSWHPDRERIVEEIPWARELHAARGTRLVEFRSAWFADGTWDARLRDALAAAGADGREIEPLDWAALLARLSGTDGDVLGSSDGGAGDSGAGIADGSADGPHRSTEGRAPHGPAPVESALRWFRQMTARYLQLLAEGGHDPGQVFDPATAQPDGRRIALFKQLVQPVWESYQKIKEGQGRIDFADMIRRSRQAVEAGRYSRRYTQIIVDEYQDVSRSKLGLLLALRRQTPGSCLTCVGDDWQAINRFAGGDLGLMTGFGAQVGAPPWEMRLDTTFRFNQALAEISGWFVQQNPAQIAKSLRSAIPAAGDDVISIHAPHEGPDDFRPVLHALDEIAGRAKPGASVCILARYRRLLGDVKETAAMLQRRHPGLTISLSTVHQYKGKESDWVIAGWLTDDRLGFPCLRLDDPIIAELLPASERYPFAEERRLFYVALTRARRGLYLVCDEARPSPFVIELEREWVPRKRIRVVNLGKAPNLPCPSCRKGALVPRSGPRGLFYACQNAPACAYREPPCPACGIGMMVASGDLLTCSDESCRHQVRKCPRCESGRLVRRQNRATQAWFWGCTAFADPEVRCGFTEPE